MKCETISIDSMNIADLGEILCMDSSASPVPWSKNMFIQEMQNPFSHCFSVKTKEFPVRIIGFICFRRVADESELFNICVHPQCRQLGIGKKLMEFYISFCNKMNVRTFYLEVNSSNHSAIHLYQSCSYRSYGIRKRFYKGEFDALLMVKKT